MNITKAEQLAKQLMRQHGLLKRGWSFEFMNSYMVFGQVRPGWKCLRLSRAFVKINNKSEVRDSILHEIAHALTPRDPGHGKAWKLMASKLGATATTCISESAVLPPLPSSKPNFRAVCCETYEVVRLGLDGFEYGRCICRKRLTDKWEGLNPQAKRKLQILRRQMAQRAERIARPRAPLTPEERKFMERLDRPTRAHQNKLSD